VVRFAPFAPPTLDEREKAVYSRGPHINLMKTKLSLPLFVLVPGIAAIQFFVASAWADNWPAWRGPEGTGVAPEKNLPLHWSTNENIRWKTPLPERGNSTPIVWKDRVFITQSVESRRTLMCFDRADGKLLWQEGPTHPGKEMSHETNPQSSSSPVTDSERVIAWFGSAGLYCYDFQGKEIWHRDLGEQRHIWGYGSSPILYHDLCILNFGPGTRTFLIAVEKKTGKTVWQIDEPGGDSGENKPGESKPAWIGSWSTPIMIKAAGREELVLSWPKRVVAFDPKSGKELWTCSGLNALAYTSPLYDKKKEIVVAMGGFGGMSLAVKAGGSGDVTETRRLWHHPKTKQRIGSGVIHDGYIYILNDPGVAECFELETGKLVWEERLKGPASRSDNWSSMVLTDGKLYAVNQGGDAFVLKASPKFEVLATNSLGEPTIGSMAVSDGQIFIRTYQSLCCIGEGGK
jgi:outer membrane protein assembly factor BamB